MVRSAATPRVSNHEATGYAVTIQPKRNAPQLGSEAPAFAPPLETATSAGRSTRSPIM
jgi:hypothetical protein